MVQFATTLDEVLTLRADVERLRRERDQWNNDARRLSGGLVAIAEAADGVAASVLRSVAYDVALNCIEPDVARYQIERRAAASEQLTPGGKDG